MSSWRRNSLSWIEQQGLYSTCPLGFQPPPHLWSCIGSLLRQELNLKHVSLFLKLWSFTNHPILGNFCLFPPMNPPRVCKVQMTLTVYTLHEPRAIGEKGMPIILFLTLPSVYIINCQLQLNRSTPKIPLKVILTHFFFPVPTISQVLQFRRIMHCTFWGFAYYFLFLFFIFLSACEFQFIERIPVGAHGKQNAGFIILSIYNLLPWSSEGRQFDSLLNP